VRVILPAYNTQLRTKEIKQLFDSIAERGVASLAMHASNETLGDCWGSRGYCIYTHPEKNVSFQFIKLTFEEFYLHPAPDAPHTEQIYISKRHAYINSSSPCN